MPRSGRKGQRGRPACFPDPERKGRKNVAAAEALDLVAGFTVLVDLTARKLQGQDREKQHPWLRSKSFETFCPLGPWVVSKQHLPGFRDLEISLPASARASRAPP